MPAAQPCTGRRRLLFSDQSPSSLNIVAKSRSPYKVNLAPVEPNRLADYNSLHV